MGEQVNKTKKRGSINAFVIVFLVIVGCYILSLFISPGAFEREQLNGRTVVIANSYHVTDKIYLGPQAIFQAVPNGLVSSAGMMFLVMLVAGCIEVYKRTGALNKGVARILSKSERVGHEKILVLIMIIFGALGGFLGWNEQIVPFIPIVLSLCLALGYDLMTGIACSAMIDMISFSFSPTSVYTVGISDEIAELPMFSGFLFRFILLCVADFIIILYVLRYARGVRSGKIQSLTADLDSDKFRVDYSQEMREPLTGGQSLSLLFFVVVFITAIAGVAKFGWSMNDLSACFLFTAIVAGFINRMAPNDIVNAICAGAKDGLVPALVIGLARGIQWILTASGIIDPIIYSISMPLKSLPGPVAAIAVMFVIHHLGFRESHGAHAHFDSARGPHRYDAADDDTRLPVRRRSYELALVHERYPAHLPHDCGYSLKEMVEVCHALDYDVICGLYDSLACRDQDSLRAVLSRDKA